MEQKHLWEIDHPYYCSTGCYFTSEPCHSEYGSWQEFIEEWGEADEDYNLVFRFDWSEEDPDSYPVKSTYNYRNGRLKIHFFMQRKAYPMSTETQVCRADEPAVREYLQKKFNHLKKLWEPLA